MKRGRRWLISKKRNSLFLYIPKTSSTFGSGILTSSTTSSTASSNVFQASHGNQVNPKASHERCQKKARALSLSLSLFLSPWEVKFSSPKPSEPSEARRARLQNIILSGNAYIHEARVRCLRKKHPCSKKALCSTNPFPLLQS